MRNLCTVRVIKKISPIPGADKIEFCKVDGWGCVVQKGEFQPGDKCIYCEIDSWIPHKIAPFLTKPGKEPKIYKGVKGELLKTVKIKNTISQGLILKYVEGEVGDDVTEKLGVLQWEPSEPLPLRGSLDEKFPCFIPKTSQPRIQNMFHLLTPTWEVTEKLDGESMTCYHMNGRVFVCSRNMEVSENSRFGKCSRSEQLGEKLIKYGKNIALQGELMKGKFYLFDIFLLDEQKYMHPYKRRELCEKLEITHVPVLEEEATLPPFNLEVILLGGEGESKIPRGGFKEILKKESLARVGEREGVVWKANLRERRSFKVISNKYLLEKNRKGVVGES